MSDESRRTFIGACRYCGQISTDQPPGLETQEEADEWVTDRCRCTNATMARSLRDRIEEAKGRVRELWGEGCERYGFQPVQICEKRCAFRRPPLLPENQEDMDAICEDCPMNRLAQLIGV